MKKAVWCLLVCLCWFWNPVQAMAEASLEQAPDPTLEAIKDRHPELAEYYRESFKELDAMKWADGYFVPDAAARRRLREWHDTPRPQEEANLIVNTLQEAYKQDPPDWPVVCAALRAARQGVPDTRVTDLARTLVDSAGTLPDEAMLALNAAMHILVLSGNKEDVERVAKCTSREFLGVEVPPGKTGFIGGPREIEGQCALIVIYFDAPLDLAIPALRGIVKRCKHGRPEDAAYDGFIKGNAEQSLDKLKQVKKGKKVALPVP